MRALLFALAAVLAGCSAPATDGPSLAPRPAEAIDPRVPVPEAPVQVAADPALASRLGALVNEAETAHARFTAAVPSTRAAAARAGASGSESWVAAQQALSALIAIRAPLTRALADVDALATDRIRQFGGIGAADLQAIESATARIGELNRSEAAVIDELQARLR